MFEDIPCNVLEAVPQEEVVRRRVIPIGVEGRELHLAAIDCSNLSNLSSMTGYRIILYVAPEIRIVEALERYYGVRRRVRFIVPTVISHAAGARREPAFRKKPPPHVPRPAVEEISTKRVIAVNAEL